jgi:hypothetical protein
MDETSEAQLAALRRLAAIAQSGLHYSKDPYDQQRYSEMEKVVRNLLSTWSGAGVEELSRVLPTRPVPATPIHSNLPTRFD